MKNLPDAPRLSIPDGTSELPLMQSALAYVYCGWYLLPVNPQALKNPGSIVGNEWQLKSSNDPDKIRYWWNKYPNAGIALHTGRSGAVAADMDCDSIPEKYALFKQGSIQLSRLNGSQRGHYVFATQEKFVSGKLVDDDGLLCGEVRSGNTVIIAAPTPHVKGGEYRWQSIGLVPELPSSARALFVPYSAKDCIGAEEFCYANDSGTELHYLNNVIKRLHGFIEDGEKSGHDAMFDALCLSLKQSHAGFYPAKLAMRKLRDVWDDLYPPGSVGHDRSEWRRMVQDSVNNANGDDPVKRREMMVGIIDLDNEQEAIATGVKKERIRREVIRIVNQQNAQKLFEANSEQALDGVSFLELESEGTPIWGFDKQALWAPGQGHMIFGTDGTGKSAIMQQITFSRLGLRDGFVLGMPVEQSDKVIVYLALDRPRQIQASMNRMVDLTDPAVRSRIKEKLVVWKGTLPVKCDVDSDQFVDWILQISNGNAGLLMGDSVKDMISKCTDDEAGMGFNDVVQKLLGYGIEVGVCHHNRKNGSNNTKPRNLDDVYGSRWLVAGLGSVLNIWKMDNVRRELTQLKTPYGDPVPAIEYEDDYSTGISSPSKDGIDIIMSELASVGEDGLTIEEVVYLLYKKDKDVDIDFDAYRSKARRTLNRICPMVKVDAGVKVKDGSPIEYIDGKRDGKSRKIWRMKVL